MAVEDVTMDNDIPPIAIVGIGCRFPGDVIDTETLWDLLSKGRDTWSKTPPERFNEDAFLHPNPDQNGAYSHRGGHFLSQDVTSFDADFFRIPRTEALAMDPEHRMAVETTYEALENSGITLEGIRGSQSSVFFANFTHDYDRNIYKDPMDIPKYHTTGSGQAIISNRLSYLFDLKGPSMTLDTGCSGGMVAIHQACQSLRTKETDMAIAGGVNMIMSPDHMLALSKMRMLNENGKSYSFDARGSGYGRGEGCASVILKRLDDALLAGDPVRAVIRNTGVNQDGKTNGITVPNAESQAFLARQTFARASIDSSEVDYIEAHGTGTAAGDLAEVNAIATVFGKSAASPLLIGSIKSNIGHLEACSGLAGLIKAVLVLEKGEIPPTINHEVPRPELKLHEKNIKVPTRLIQDQRLRRVSVNSFGYGGTNGHLILEKTPSRDALRYSVKRSRAPEREPSYDIIGPYLFFLSARSSSSLVERIRKLARWTSLRKDELYLTDLAYTLSFRRSVLDWRLSFVAGDHNELVSALSPEESLKQIRKSTKTRPVFLFTGQGAQWYAMGAELIESCAKFRETICRCQQVLQNLGASWDLITELTRGKSESRVEGSEIAQPATTSLQLALVECFREIGIRPEYVLGHSSGEIAAAFAAGALSLDSAMEISYHRGFMSDFSKAMSSKRGAMLAVGLGEGDVQEHIKDINSICIGCINSTQSVTLSGDEEGIIEAKQRFNSLSIFNRALKVDTAYHSRHMQLAAQEYLRSIYNLDWKDSDSSIHFISSVTGEPKTSDFGPTYWVDNLTSQVRYYHALSEMCRQHQKDSPASLALIELGPHAALSGPTAQTFRSDFKDLEYSYYPTLRRDKSASQTFLEAIGKLFTQGCDMSIENVYKLCSSTPGHTLSDLPRYPWDHSTKFWHESWLSRNYRLRKYPYHDLLGVSMESSTPLELSWRHFLSTDDMGWLSDHVVDGLTIFPGAGYLCMAFEAMRQINRLGDAQNQRHRIVLKDVRFLRALIIPKAPARTEVRLNVNQASSGAVSNTEKAGITWYEFRVSALVNEDWNKYCQGFMKIEFDSTETKELSQRRLVHGHNHHGSKTLMNGHTQRPNQIDAQDLYRELRTNGNDYGEYFALVKQLELSNEHGAESTLQIPDTTPSMPANHQEPHLIHPTTLDALMHASLALYYYHNGHDSIMPVRLGEISVSSIVENVSQNSLFSHSSLKSAGSRSAYAKITVANSGESNFEEPIVEVKNLELRGLGKKHPSTPAASQMHQRMEWRVDADYYATRRTALSKGPESTNGMAINGKHPKQMNLLNQAAAIYVSRALNLSNKNTPTFARSTLQNLLTQMMYYGLPSQQELGKFTTYNAAEEDALLQQVGMLGLEGNLLNEVGPNLLSAFTGDLHAPKLLEHQQKDMLLQYYDDAPSRVCYKHAAELLDLLSFKSPHLRVLEVGGGTAAASSAILEALEGSKHKIGSYEFTDPSEDVLNDSAKHLEKFKSFVDFKRLDVEVDFEQQDYEQGSYDVVIASHMFSGVASSKKELDNMRRLLKPGGWLLMIQNTTLMPFARLLHEALSASWRGISVDPTEDMGHWDDALTSAGFENVQFIAADAQTQPQPCNMWVCRAPENGVDLTIPFFVEFITQDFPTNSIQQSLIQELHAKFWQRQWNVSFTTWSRLEYQENKLYIIIDRSSNSVMSSLTTEIFSRLIRLMKNGEDVLWITTEDTDAEDANPERDLITGFARSAHAENEELRLVRVDMQQYNSDVLGRFPDVISDLIDKSFRKDRSTLLEREYIYRDGELLIPRLVPNEEACEWLGSAFGKPTIQEEPFHHIDRDERLVLSRSDGTSGTTFTQHSDLPAKHQSNEVEIQPRAVSLSPGLLNNTLSQSLSLVEFSGEVVSVGAQVTAFSRGDRVCGCGFAPFSNRVILPAENVHRLPNTVSTPTGASIPIAFVTAYCCLANVAHVRSGQVVLVNEAISDVGQATLTLAGIFHLKVIALVKSTLETEMLSRNYGAQLLGVLIGESTNIEEVDDLTNGEGADVVVNCSFVDSFGKGEACLAPFGTFVQIEPPILDAKPFRNEPRVTSNVTHTSLNLAQYLQEYPKRMNKLLKDIFGWLDCGIILPIHSLKVFPVEQLDEAVQEVEKNDSIGKFVVQATRDSTVKTIRTHRPRITLDSHGTYVVAGGLGYIGSRICHLLVERGAKHLVVLSRKIGSSPRQQELGEELMAIDAGVKIYWQRCDIGDHFQVDQVKQDLAAQGAPQIKGIVQTTVVLQDCTLENMTLNDYEVSLRNKVHGTSNLNNTFGNLSLSFFLSLSSTTGVIGSRGQANYSAANTYLDSFANCAPKNSEAHYVSVDIGMVGGSEVNESSSLVDNLTRQGLTTIEMHELITLLEYAISPECKSSGCNQIVSGIDSTSVSRVNVPNSNAKSAMFSHFQQDIVAAPGDEDGSKCATASFKEMVAQAEDIQEVHQAAITSISRKLMEIIAFSNRQVDPESSMTDLGLDSLVTMELRNWINKEFQATVTTADVLDQPTLRALAVHVAENSDIVRKAYAETVEKNGDCVNGAEASNSPADPDRKRHAMMVKLPALPVPDLHESMRQLRESRESFISAAELKRWRQRIDDFCDPAGLGTKLQKRLIERTKDDSLGFWQEGLYAEPIYLTRRESPYPNTIFFAGHLIKDDIVHSQAKRAAVISASAFRFKQRMEAGLVSPDTLNEEPMSMDSWRWLFNATREPCEGVDMMRKWAGHDHLVALRRGHVFRVELKTSSGRSMSVRELEMMFTAMIAESEEAVSAVATLTSDGRDEWGEYRRSLAKSSQQNSETLQMIESAAFVVSLDDGVPETPSQRCNQFFFGDSSNRWTDKNVHFVVCENGVSAMVCEHSMLDGLSVKALHSAITDAILSEGISLRRTTPSDSPTEWEIVSSEVNGTGSPLPSASHKSTLQPNSEATASAFQDKDAPLYSEHVFNLSKPSTSFTTQIQHLRTAFNNRFAPIELTHHTIQNIGATFFRSHRVSPKTGFQLVIQLACLKFYAEQPESWETVSMARFHRGRVDWIQAVEPPVKTFCAAAAAAGSQVDSGIIDKNKTDVSVLKNMFLEAANSYTNRMTKISRGHGFVAHMYALLALAEEEEARDQTELPALFRDPQWTATGIPSVKRVKTDCVEGLDLQETCFLMPKPECIYLHFEPKDDRCKFFVQTWPGLSARMCETLDWAAERVGEILSQPDGH